MRFSDFIEESGKSRTEVANELGCSRQAVRRYVLGERIPRADEMQKIFEWSGGKVTANDFYGLNGGEANVSHVEANTPSDGRSKDAAE